MRLVMTLVVRDEADVLRENLDYHLHRGVDHVLVTDHRSRDATPDILDDYERKGLARVFREEAATSEQAAWVTRMARLAATEYGADWVINSDADEFWWPVAGTLKDMLGVVPDAYGALAVPARNFIPREGSDAFWRRMFIREARSRNLVGDPLEPKAAHRARPDIEVDHGNHWVAAPRLRTAPLGDIRTPVVARMPPHRRQDPAAKDEGTQIPAGMPDELLHVEHGLRAFDGAEGAPRDLDVADANHAASLGAEQRLDDDVAAEPFKRLHRGLEPLADERGRSWQTRACEHRA